MQLSQNTNNSLCLPLPEKESFNEIEWYKEIHKGTALEQPLVCNKCKTIGQVVHVKHPIFWRYFLYLVCDKCQFCWRVYYEHTIPVQIDFDCTSQDKSASFCIRDGCTDPKMGNYNCCRPHFEEWP